jgi:hypothetical protein
MNNIKRLPLFAALAVLALPGTALAGDSTVTGTVNPGSLTIAPAATSSFSLTLNGADQTKTYTIPSVLTDATGSDAGWNLTVTSTQFNDGSGHTIPATASNITGVTNTCSTGATCTPVTNSTTPNSFPAAVPAGASAPTAVEFFSADASTGEGKWDTTPTVSVVVPANTHAAPGGAAYTSTVTLAAVSGP